MEQFRALIAKIKAGGKKDFAFADYPVRVRKNGSSDLPAEEGSEYVAQIINWWMMTGLGSTPEAAREDLRRRFEEYRANGNELPRPGEQVQITFASSESLDPHGDLPTDLIYELFGITVMFISDGSSLRDFAGEEEVAEAINKIQIIYGVDVSDIDDGNLALICERIRNRPV